MKSQEGKDECERLGYRHGFPGPEDAWEGLIGDSSIRGVGTWEIREHRAHRTSMFVLCGHLSFVELYIKINTRRVAPVVDTFQAAIYGYSCEVFLLAPSPFTLAAFILQSCILQHLDGMDNSLLCSCQ